jgi:transposase
LTLRPLADDEARELERLAHARTEPAGVVGRARMVWRVHRGERVPAVAAALGVDPDTVRRWVKRVNAGGLDALADDPRSGRPVTYTAAEVGLVVATSLTDPAALGLPFGSWTLDRLAAYLHEQKGLAIGRSRIGELLQREGLRWRTQETWFGARPDPAFAEKRGPSSPSTNPPRRAAS